MTDREAHELIQATIAAHTTPDAHVIAIAPHAHGAQGYSGAILRYYDVTYRHGGRDEQITLVTKDAPLRERRTLAWLGERQLPVPFSYTADLTTDAPALICMQHAGDAPLRSERARQAAHALAAIHAATLGRGAELLWLPRADPAFFAGRLIDRCWRKPWRHALTGAGYRTWDGRDQEPVPPDSAFQAAFSHYTPLLEDAAARFLHAMTALWERGDALTLIHADFHGEHVRSRAGRASIIDWEQAHYGPLYVDLPNYFSREEALLYRDALADLGHDIPRDEFLTGYAAADPYPGFKYFGIGLSQWRNGAPPRQHSSVRYWINMVLQGAATGRTAPAGG
jgi:aminoglycoside phosphotransferase (APT) family kinase protein